MTTRILTLLFKLATDDSWDSRKYVLWLSCEKKLCCTKITYTRFAVRTIFSRHTFFARKSLRFCNFTVSGAKQFEVRNTRNLSHKVTTATRINLYTRFISRMFSCCEQVLRTSRESSVADFIHSGHTSDLHDYASHTRIIFRVSQSFCEKWHECEN